MPDGKRSSRVRSRRVWPCAGGSGATSHSGALAGSRGRSAAGASPGCSRTSLVTPAADLADVLLSSRSDNCRASSLNALFSTGESTGDFASPIGRNGTTFCARSTSASNSAGAEMSSAVTGGSCGSRSITSPAAGGCVAAACSDSAAAVSAPRGRAAGSTPSLAVSSRRISTRCSRLSRSRQTPNPR